jgi:hypothetical protein
VVPDVGHPVLTHHTRKQMKAPAIFSRALFIGLSRLRRTALLVGNETFGDEEFGCFVEGRVGWRQHDL